MDKRIERSPLEHHKELGHDTYTITGDYTNVSESGDLMLEGQRGNELLIAGYSSFEHLDLTKNSTDESPPGQS